MPLFDTGDEMTTHPGLKILGGAAVLAGCLRFAEELSIAGQIPAVPADLKLPLYWTIDVLILAGLIGFAWAWRGRWGLAGWIGWGLAVVGVVMLRLPGETLAGVNRYQLAAGLLTLGLAVIGVAIIAKRFTQPWIGAVWLSTFLIGIASLFLPEHAGWLTQAAAASFSIGMIGAGAEILSPDSADA